jgi:hypothetical protein
VQPVGTPPWLHRDIDDDWRRGCALGRVFVGSRAECAALGGLFARSCVSSWPSNIPACMQNIPRTPRKPSRAFRYAPETMSFVLRRTSLLPMAPGRPTDESGSTLRADCGHVRSERALFPTLVGLEPVIGEPSSTWLTRPQRSKNSSILYALCSTRSRTS